MELSPALSDSSAKSTCTYNKPSGHKNHVTIVYYNARSLIPKMDELKAVSEATKPDIIYIVETWLDSVITDIEVDLPDYQLFRLDRCGHGGGIAIYVRTFLSCKVMLQGGTFALSLSIVNFCVCFVCVFFTVHHHLLFLFLIIFVPLCRFYIQPNSIVFHR